MSIFGTFDNDEDRSRTTMLRSRSPPASVRYAVSAVCRVSTGSPLISSYENSRFSLGSSSRRARPMMTQWTCAAPRASDVAWRFVVAQAGEVVERLFLGGLQVASRRFLLDQQFARPEKVDEPTLARPWLHRAFKGSNPSARDAEHFEKSLLETLRFAFFVRGVVPVARKLCCTSANIIPNQDAC